MLRDNGPSSSIMPRLYARCRRALCCFRAANALVCAATATFATATAAVKERGELCLRLSYILRAGRARVVGQAGRAVPFVA